MCSLRIDGLAEMTGVAVQGVADALRLAAGGVTSGDVTVKAGRDIVTAMDVAVEDALRTRLAAAFGLPVIGEERGGEAPADGSGYWLVDPICGTRNSEAGAVVSDVDGEPWTLGSDTLVAAASPDTHRELLTLLDGQT